MRGYKPYNGHRHLIDALVKISAALVIFVLLAAVIKLYASAADRPICNATDAPIYLVYIPSQAEIDMIAKTVWGEARGLGDTEKAAVVWTILNRVDSPAWPDTIKEVITQKWQFAGYRTGYPVTQSIRALVVDVAKRWIAEQFGETDVGRVLPTEYMWFTGDGRHNTFKKLGGEVWRWTLPTPYED
jgi:hypothetical protein